MDQPRTVLFLCTGNYYRSRFAEVLFNSVAGKMGLSWKAYSRGLALERGLHNVGPMSKSAIQFLDGMGVQAPMDIARFPVSVIADDFQAARLIVALDQAEHQPLMEERFPEWVEKIEYWNVHDIPGILHEIEQEVMDLMARLMGGSKSEQPTQEPIATKAKEKVAKKSVVVRVGRETKGRRGKGVTIIFDLPLDEAGLRELAAQLKQRCGTGGTVKDGRIEIQGDQRERLAAELKKLGYQVKRTGG